MARRGLSEKVVWAHNPLPNVSHAQILERAGLDMRIPREAPAFRICWQYSGGVDMENIVLEPGDFHPFREREAKDIEQDLRDQGVVLVTNREDKDEVIAKAEQGLRRAREFYQSRGLPKLMEYRARAGITAEELAERKYADGLWSYHENAAKAGAIEDAIREVQKQRVQRASMAAAREAKAAKSEPVVAA